MDIILFITGLVYLITELQGSIHPDLEFNTGFVIAYFLWAVTYIIATPLSIGIYCMAYLVWSSYMTHCHQTVLLTGPFFNINPKRLDHIVSTLWMGWLLYLLI